MLYKVARLLQFAGLIILPVAVAGNVGEHITLKASLALSAVGITVFLLGWLLQQQSKGKK